MRVPTALCFTAARSRMTTCYACAQLRTHTSTKHPDADPMKVFSQILHPQPEPPTLYNPLLFSMNVYVDVSDVRTRWGVARPPDHQRGRAFAARDFPCLPRERGCRHRSGLHPARERPVGPQQGTWFGFFIIFVPILKF